MARYENARQLIETFLDENDDKILVGFDEKEKFTIDFSRFSNMLVTGTTGSGKTGFVQSVLTEIIIDNTPDKVNLVVFDSKGVDYNFLSESGFLLFPVIKDRRVLNNAINWLLKEAEDRRKDISSLDLLPRIVLIIDDYYEVVDNCRNSIVKLLQTGRTVKINCIIVTSTPTSEIVSTSMIANMPYRIAFHTATKSISRMVIDEAGAEVLKTPGELIFIDPNSKRKGQAVFLEYEEIEEIVSRRKANNGALSNGITKQIQLEATLNNLDENLLYDCACLVVDRQKAAIGMLQRTFKLGFNHAADIMDALEDMGIVGEEVGVRPREVLVNKAELEEIFKRKAQH